MDHIPESLVTYDNPVLVTKNIEKISPKTMPLSTATLDPVLPPPKAKSSTTEASNQQIVEILDAILPPREWTENNQLFLQHLSIKPSTRKDVSQLQEKLDLQLKQRQAREKGMCSVRRELYTQCFDELIRQVTINCAERGLLLLRVRDEIRMTIAAYQTLYESSVAFGLRKALQAEQGKSDMEKKVVNYLPTFQNHIMVFAYIFI